MVEIQEVTVQVIESSNLTLVEEDVLVVEEYLTEAVVELNESEFDLVSVTEQGLQGVTGADGKSAYEIAVENGFIGTEQEWLDSLSAAGGDANYVFIQVSAQSIWNIVHNLNKFPSVTVVDSGGSVVVGEIHYIDNNSLTLTFSAPFSGRAYLN